MRIALIGADGQLGSDLNKILQEKHEVFPLFFPDFDVTHPAAISQQLTELAPDAVINTAAYNQVDEAETESLMSFKLNSLAVRDLSFVCRKLDAVLVHFSTDYVFGGEKNEPYIEGDTTCPLSTYGITKLSGEYFLSSILKKYFLIRTSGLYGEAGCWGKGTNFIDAMIEAEKKGNELRVVNDQWITPTSTWELALRVDELIQRDEFGLFHMTNEGKCSWFQFTEAIFSLLGKKTLIIPINSKEYGAKAHRPAYSVPENKKSKSMGLQDFSHWKTALADYLKRKGYLT